MKNGTRQTAHGNVQTRLIASVRNPFINKMKPLTALIILTLFTFTTLFAQSKSAIKKADTWLEKKEFRQAAIEYEALIGAAEKNRKTTSETKIYLYSRLGETYLNLREYFHAETGLEKARHYGANDSVFLKHYARALQANRDVSGDPNAQHHPVTLETKLNIANNQYNLAWYEGSLLFSCDRASPSGDDRGIAPTTFFTSRPLYNFNNSRVDGWAVPEQIDRIESDPAYFVHSFVYDENTSTYYVMRCVAKSKMLDNRCNIFSYREETNGKMSKPTPQSFHRTDANIGHPTLSSDGNVMVFTQEISGHSNLYMVRKTSSDNWTEPLRLSSVINTAGNETYPKLFQDSILFFSSDGHPGLGGLDIFYTKITVNGDGHGLSEKSDFTLLEFSQPVNLGVPINSGADDVSFLLKSEAAGGFFISNRTVDGQNRSQIYSFKQEPVVFEQQGLALGASSKNRNLSGIEAKSVEFVIPQSVNTERSKLNAQVAKLNQEVFGLNSEVSLNNAEIAGLNDERLNTRSDKDKLNAQQRALLENNTRLNVEITKLNTEIAKRDAELIKLDRQKTPPTDERSRLDAEITKQNVHITKQNADITKQNAEIFDLNRKSTILIEMLYAVHQQMAVLETELAQLSSKTPETEAEREFLESEKTRVRQMISKLQEDQAKLEEDESDLTLQKRIFYDRNVLFTHNLRAFNEEIERLNDEIERLNHEITHLNDEIARLNTEQTTKQDTVFVEKIVEVRVEVPVETLVGNAIAGEILVLRNIYFENNSTELKRESEEELTRFVRAMRANPGVRVEISGHTDAMGTLTHNQKLSEGRAKAVRDYLVLNGIDAQRLEYVGHNYSKNIVSNATSEGRAKNRRVEIKIL